MIQRCRRDAVRGERCAVAKDELGVLGVPDTVMLSVHNEDTGLPEQRVFYSEDALDDQFHQGFQHAMAVVEADQRRSVARQRMRQDRMLFARMEDLALLLEEKECFESGTLVRDDDGRVLLHDRHGVVYEVDADDSDEDDSDEDDSEAECGAMSTDTVRSGRPRVPREPTTVHWSEFVGAAQY